MTSSRTSSKEARSPESFESLRRRNAAAEILQSYERLSWYSMQRCENIIAGFTPDDEAALVDWKIDNAPHPPKPGDVARGKSNRKGKERASLGDGGSGNRVTDSSRRDAAEDRERGDGNTFGGGGGGETATKKRKGAGTG